MKSVNRLGSRWVVPLFMTVLTGVFLVAPAGAQLASPGNNAVYNSSGNVALSPAFIDASVFVGSGQGQGSDICDALFKILSGDPNFFKNGYPSTGAVIDARGISGATNLTCSHGTPWTEGNTTVNVPSTILLPATGAVAPNNPTPIIISTPWILPPNTHLIGEGDGIPSTGFTPATTIQAASSFSGTTMIQFGPSATFCLPPGEGTTVCVGISVENLTLDGQSQSINGITNQLAGDPSPVNHVSLYRIVGTGLLVSDSANNSGPYSNITFDAGGLSVQGTVCAQILNTSSTHGMTKGTFYSGGNSA
jgi:hypothetical protein